MNMDADVYGRPLFLCNVRKESWVTSLDNAWGVIIQFSDQYFPAWRKTEEIYLSNALAGEVGELCNLVKHRAGGGTKKSCPSIDELMEECADIFIYLELLCEIHHIDFRLFASHVGLKILKNKERMSTSQNQGSVR